MVLVIGFLVEGCAVGNKYNFSSATADLQLSTTSQANLAVATLDQREDILSGNCPPSYVGMQRAGFGNPWRVHTETGLPFAQDVTNAVCASLAKKGFRAVPVVVAHDLAEREAVRRLMAKSADRSILVLIKKWESDTYVNIGLDYDVRIKVLGLNQKVLAEAAQAETRTIPGNFWDPPSAAKEQIPLAFKQILEKLLNDPEIMVSLK